jgi:hypothetical protein
VIEALVARLMPWRWLVGIAVVGALLAAVWAWDKGRLSAQFEAGYVKAKAEWAQADNVRDDAASAAREVEAKREAKRIEKQREIDDATEREMQTLRADADAAAAAGGRLRKRVADLLAARGGQAGPDQPIAGDSAPAEDAARVLADVLGRCVDRVRLLAVIADERGAAGGACERSYQTLIDEVQP